MTHKHYLEPTQRELGPSPLGVVDIESDHLTEHVVWRVVEVVDKIFVKLRMITQFDCFRLSSFCFNGYANERIDGSTNQVSGFHDGDTDLLMESSEQEYFGQNSIPMENSKNPFFVLVIHRN